MKTNRAGSTGWRRWPAVVVAACLATIVGAQIPARAADGPCISADIPGELRLPDGSVHPAGRLTLCHSRPFSPVVSLHATFMDGRPVGLMLGRDRPNEAAADDAPLILLHRDSSGQLALAGYLLPSGGESTTYLFANQRGPIRKRRDQVAARSRRPAPLMVAAALSSERGD